MKPIHLWARTYPTRIVHLIVGFPPGGTGDSLARIVASALSDRLSQQVIVENRPGGGSSVATRTMLGLPADGHTLLLVGSSTVVNALLPKRTQPTLLEDLVPVAGLTASAFVIVVNSSAKQKTLVDLISYAKTYPGALRVGSYGAGTQSHLAAQLFCKHTGIDVTLVPYRGSALMINDLLGQHIKVAFDAVGSVLPHIKSGALRALAVTTAKRLNHILPEVPTAMEVVPGYEVIVWTGLAVRKGTPSDILDRLNHESTAALNDPTIIARLTDLAMDSMPSSRDEFVAFWSEDVKRTRKLIHDLGIDLE